MGNDKGRLNHTAIFPSPAYLALAVQPVGHALRDRRC